MKFGMMNNPANNLEKEIKFIARRGFDFIDLTLEGTANHEKIDTVKIKRLLEKHKIGVIGHTAWWLMPGDEFSEFRRASVAIFKKDLKIFSKLGARCVNIHALVFSQLIGIENISKFFISSLNEMLKEAKKYDIEVMLENLEPVTDINFVSAIMKAIPDLKLHLDVGHANLKYKKNKTEDYFRKFSKRISHIHVSDNLGGKEDLHLAIGKGNIKWEKIVAVFKKYKYDKTITLEIFKGGRKALIKSRNKLIDLLEKCHKKEDKG